MPEIPDAMEAAVAHYQAGRLQEAKDLCEIVLRAHPEHVEALHLLGVSLRQLSCYSEAVETFRQALQIAPESPAILADLIVAHLSAGEYEEAVIACHTVLRHSPDNYQAIFHLGFAHHALGNLTESAANFERAVELRPSHSQAHQNLANVRYSQGRIDEAASGYRRAMELAPQHAEVHFNLGGALRKQGKLDEARACLDRALELKPRYAKAHKRRGDILGDQGKQAEAVSSYTRALELVPNDAATFYAMGIALRRGGDFQAAIESYQRSLALQPHQPETLYSLGNAYADVGRLDQAIESYQQAVLLKPDYDVALSALIHESMQCCSWTGLEGLSERLLQMVDAGSGEIAPFNLLSLPTTLEQQFRCARQRIQRRVAGMQVAAPIAAFTVRGPRGPRIKLGYLSADFRRHPISYLLADVIEQHDRDRFEVVAYSFGLDDQSSMRARMVSSFDQFVDIRSLSHREAASRIYADQCDILIDLMGHTRDSRLEILALRPAPIQVAYLGYPGTTGAQFIDYLLADEFTVPTTQQHCFSEKLVHLPGCLLPSDSAREVSDRTPTRQQCGLPSDGFVFCSFNNSYKITPQIFNVWMNLLRETPGSVLWLAQGNPYVPENLRIEARQRGVDQERLVFAPRLPHLADHLARYRLADLFLDTFPYNAHTTASDSLWVGCPVVTIAGQTFASRVAASLLKSVNLSELATSSLADYQQIAWELARSEERLAELRARLREHRGASGLIDGVRMARHLESAYARMFQIHTDGQLPQTFSLVQGTSSCATKIS